MDNNGELPGRASIVGRERAGRIYIMARLPESKPGEVMVIGNVRSYSFFATVQKEHAADPASELGQSRITTLYLRDQKLQPVYRWDRGRDIAPKNDDVRAAMAELTEHLASKIFGPMQSHAVNGEPLANPKTAVAELKLPKRTYMLDKCENVIIDQVHPRTSAPGYWVTGTVKDYLFTAAVFAQHSSYPSYELGRSRIGKLELRSPEMEVVFHWDRGLEELPNNIWKTAAVRGAVHELETHLAKRVFDVILPKIQPESPSLKP